MAQEGLLDGENKTCFAYLCDRIKLNHKLRLKEREKKKPELSCKGEPVLSGDQSVHFAGLFRKAFAGFSIR